MKYFMLLPRILFGFNLPSQATAQDHYPNFALVVHVPSYEAFLTNLGDSPTRVDGYAILSASGSLSVAGWAALNSADPEIVAALGPGADGFFLANPSQTSLAELNPLSSATWQPGQSWSIGFPFNSADPDFVFDAVFKFASPDGLVLTGGTVVPPSQLALAALLAVPEPSTFILAFAALSLCFARRCRRRTLPRPLREGRGEGTAAISLIFGLALTVMCPAAGLGMCIPRRRGRASQSACRGPWLVCCTADASVVRRSPEPAPIRPRHSPKKVNMNRLTKSRLIGLLTATDYDYSGTVGPEDYAVWKANFGSTTNFDADGNDDHVVDAADYTIWRDHLGLSLGSGSGAALPSAASLSAGVPEPSAIALAALGIVVLLAINHRRWRRAAGAAWERSGTLIFAHQHSSGFVEMSVDSCSDTCFSY